MKRCCTATLVVAVTLICGCDDGGQARREARERREQCYAASSAHDAALRDLLARLKRLHGQWPVASWDDLRGETKREFFAPNPRNWRRPSPLTTDDPNNPPAPPDWHLFDSYCAEGIEPKVIISGPGQNTCLLTYEHLWAPAHEVSPRLWGSESLRKALACTAEPDQAEQVFEYPPDPERYAAELERDLSARYVVVIRIVEVDYPVPPEWTKKPSFMAPTVGSFHANVHACVYDLESETLVARYWDRIEPEGYLSYEHPRRRDQAALNESFYSACRGMISRAVDKESLPWLAYVLADNLLDPAGVLKKNE